MQRLATTTLVQSQLIRNRITAPASLRACASFRSFPVMSQTNRLSCGFRFASTTTTSKTVSQSQPEASKLSWTEYFGHKKQSRNYELGLSSVTGVTSFFAGSYYFMAVKEFDPTELVFGVMDASIAYSMGALCVGLAGGVAGVFLGGALWRGTAKPNILASIDRMDAEFFERVKKFRPQGQLRLSLQNPMPDYYAESVKSVQGYRAWLKKQRDYRIKTEGFKAMRSIKRKQH
ncbi:mitochondrial import protein Pam17-domain-containing protein [Obelidium mucronatum]|nr:mitochondrial import protein Pam17-domain-containing protein [Obelidium mucronatum]